MCLYYLMNSSILPKLFVELHDLIQSHHLQGVFKFHLLQKLRWSEVFARVNELQRRYSFEHAFVSDCSLEEIFVDIARGRHQCLTPALSTGGAGNTPKN